MKYFPSLGLYSIPQNTYYIAYICDDFGNLVGITDDQFEQNLFFRLGVIYN